MSAPIGDDVDRAAAVLRAGGLVAMPTETVYGLAADADNPAAVARIFAAKGRPADHPLIVHVADGPGAHGWTAAMPPSAARLAELCWPGPLTVVVPRAARVIDAVTGGRATVGLRVPAHPLAAALLTRFGGGLAAPSANRFGAVSPTTAEHVAGDLGLAVDYILAGGACPVGVESTIVDCTVTPAQILRSGAITDEQVRLILDGAVAPASGASRAPGMLASHYAPRAGVVLATSPDEARHLALAHGPDAMVVGDLGNLARYARLLYTWLRAADDRGASTIVALLPPAEGLGHALRDRLVKAAAASA